MGSIASALGVTAGVAMVILVLAVLQLAIQIFALVDLARRRRVAGGRRWVWLVVILVGNLVGAILYLAIGRSIPPTVDTPPEASANQSHRASATVDLLYGPDEKR